jgi:hypothetical protein
MRIGTHDGEASKENAIGKEMSTLEASDSARYQEKSFRDGN